MILSYAQTGNVHSPFSILQESDSMLFSMGVLILSALFSYKLTARILLVVKSSYRCTNISDFTTVYRGLC